MAVELPRWSWVEQAHKRGVLVGPIPATLIPNSALLVTVYISRHPRSSVDFLFRWHCYSSGLFSFGMVPGTAC